MHRTRRSVALGAIVAGALALSSLPVAAAHAGATATKLAAPTAAQCPQAVPIHSITRGMRGTGWTVAQGTTPRPFRVKVLAVFPDGINAGVDMIIVKVADVAGSDMISRVGGIWAGISGSPVYVGGRLLGSVSYSISGAPSRIAGVTPAASILPILGYPSTAAKASGTGSVRLPASLARRVAHAGHVSVAAASTMNRIPLVLSVSGLTRQARTQLQTRLNLRNANVVVVPGQSASAGGGAVERPVPGGNFAGLISYGDVTSGAIGTTTYVCGNQAIAFGHPLLFTGKVALGANDANAITVVKDAIFGNYKLATIGKLYGTVDQDRLTGIRANLSHGPTLIPVTAQVRAPEINGRRTGTSQVAGSEFVPGIAPSHLFADMLTTFDSLGPGSAKIDFVVTGRKANGQPFTFRRSNQFVDTFAIVGSSPEELYEDLSIMFANGHEPITFTGVQIKATVSTDTTSLTLTKVLVSKDGGPFRDVSQLSVNRGSHLVIRGTFSSTADGSITRDVSLTVPANAPRGGADLVVGGGGSFFNDCFFNTSACGNSFNELLDTLRSKPQNNDFAADLTAFDNSGNPDHVATNATHLTLPAFGNVDISVDIH